MRFKAPSYLWAALFVVLGGTTLSQPVWAQPSWPFKWRAYFTPSGSMNDTLRLGDRFIVDAHVHESRAPKNGEIAIFTAPEAALIASGSQGQDIDFVKRVVGVPKDVVYIVDRQLYRNGLKVSEPYSKWKEDSAPLNLRYSYDMKIVGGVVYSREYVGDKEPGLWTRNWVVVPAREQAAISKAKPEAVPAGCFVVLGDHRNNSNDSHVFGFVKRSAFHGRALFVYWPISRWKPLI